MLMGVNWLSEAILFNAFKQNNKALEQHTQVSVNAKIMTLHALWMQISFLVH